MYKLDKFTDIDLNNYSENADEHAYVNELSDISEQDAHEFEQVGIETDASGRSASFILKDMSVINCGSSIEGVEVSDINKAVETYPWLEEYMWNGISPENDMFTEHARQSSRSGYFIRSRKGEKIKQPVQACLHMSKEKLSQNVHNIVIAEEGSQMHIINGCSTSSHMTSGLHVGISEIYVKKGATLQLTMVHDWGTDVDVRPRSVTHVEEGGVLISNYISLNPVGSLQMDPVTYLAKNSVARFNSVLVASEGCNMDVGSTVILQEEGARAEIISRAITTGGTVISRGNLIGKVKGVKAHLECKGLILNDGILHAIPELVGHVPGVEMSHEAAVGKIDRREIEYLMARGLDEDEAVSTIVRGFLNVDIEGLPASLAKRMDKAIADTQDDMM